MAIVGFAFSFVHLQVLEFFAGFLEPRSCCIVFDVTILKVVYPFLQGSFSHLVKLIDADNEIFGEDFLWSFDFNDALVAGVDF